MVRSVRGRRGTPRITLEAVVQACRDAYEAARQSANAKERNGAALLKPGLAHHPNMSEER
jgi:hypothetical protein